MQIAVDPLVGGLARDTVELAQLGDRQRVTRVVGDDLSSLVHRCRFAPRHGAPPCSARECGTTCRPCPCTNLLPMWLDRARTDSNPSIERTSSSGLRPHPAKQRYCYCLTPGNAGPGAFAQYAMP